MMMQRHQYADHAVQSAASVSPITPTRTGIAVCSAVRVTQAAHGFCDHAKAGDPQMRYPVWP
jgi:hypothetical protein